MSSISVTEVRNALRCPRLFTLGRLRGMPVQFPVGSSTLGAAFHRLVDRFCALVDTPPDHFARLEAGATQANIEKSLQRWLMLDLARAIEDKPVLATMPTEADDLAEALRAFAAHLAEALAADDRAPGEALREYLHDTEVEVESTIATERGPVRLRGRIDAIHRPRSAQPQVVEYKLTGETHAELDHAQVALYRHLLRDTLDVEAVPVVLRFTPRLSVVAIEPKAADLHVERYLQPLMGSMLDWLDAPASAPPTERADLCPACPYRTECAVRYPEPLAARDMPPSGAARPRPAPDGESLATTPDATDATQPRPDEAGRREAQAILTTILEILHKQSVPAEANREPQLGPRLISIEVTGKRSIKRIDRAAEDVIHQLAAQHEVEATYHKPKGRRLFQVVRSEPRNVRLPPLLAQRQAWLSERSGRFVLGESADGDVVAGDLSSPGSPHLLVGGSAGSGKSVLLRGIAASLVHFHAPSAIRLALVDPKRVTFKTQESSLSAHLSHPIVFEVAEAIELLDGLVDAMEERYALLEEASVQDIDEYNEERPAHRPPMTRQVVIIDEFVDLTLTKDTKQPFITAVQRLGAKARAAGIHLVLATQRPDAKAVPGAIKANLEGRVALKVASATNSRIILDDKGAERLLGRGDLLANLGRGLLRAQAPLV